MENKLTTSSDIGLLFANFYRNILSANCNILKNLTYATMSPLITLSISQHLTNCAIFGQSRIALA